MKINFTKKEYRILVEMLLIADWIIHSHETDSVEKTKSYTDLRKKVLSHYKEMGLEDDFYYNPEHDDYYETKDYEERSAHMVFIDEHDERNFWSLLATKMAQRALAAEHAISPDEPVDQKQRIVRIFELAEHFEEEFSEHGLDNVRIELKTGFH
jgi:hypothetical protein